METTAFAIQYERLFLFPLLPNQSYSLDGDNDFAYIYITFHGVGALPILQHFGVSRNCFYFEEFFHLTDFWLKAVHRITTVNANALTESVFLYTLSYLTEKKENKEQDLLEELSSYINNHFSDTNLTLFKVADLFGYTKKYLSYLFKKRNGIKFTDYLTNLRIENAKNLLVTTKLSIGEIAKRSGFSDPFYFSKVFKSKTSQTPVEFRKALQLKNTSS